MAPTPEVETAEEAEERQRNYEQQRKEYQQEQERRAEAWRQEEKRQQQENEAERERREQLQKARLAKFEHVLNTVPVTFSSNQLRAFLRLLINLDPYTFTDDVAETFVIEHDDSHKTSEEILMAALVDVPDDKLTSFALRLVLTQHCPIPREAEIDLLLEAEGVFTPAKPNETGSKKVKKPTPIKSSKSKKTANDELSRSLARWWESSWIPAFLSTTAAGIHLKENIIMSTLAVSPATSTVSPYFRDGGSDKVYHAQIVTDTNDLYFVNFQYGRRGSTLQTGTKTAAPVALAQAQKIFDKLVAEKRAKGYTDGESGIPVLGWKSRASPLRLHSATA